MRTAPIRLHFGACAVVAMMMCGIVAVSGTTIQLNWTADGVRDYTSSPLRVDLGDMLELTCNENISNLFIQTDRIQYDHCNASAGSGVFDYNGICYNGNPAFLTLTENSQSLQNTVNFVNNQVYFLTSYSEGSFRGNDRTFTSGGQCEDGLKMIIVIGVANVPSVGGTAPDGTQPPTPSNQGLNSGSGSTTGVSLPIIIGAAAGGVLLVVGLCIMVIIIVVCVKKGCCSREMKMKSNVSYGNNNFSTAAYYNESMFNSEPDSQACTLTRADFSLGSKPVVEVKVQEAPQQSIDDVSVQTFGMKKSLGSVDNILYGNQHYKSADRNFDDATGQQSTPFHANTTPEHLLKAKSTSEISTSAGTLPVHVVGKPKPLPPPKPRQNVNDMYKSSSADNLISR